METNKIRISCDYSLVSLRKKKITKKMLDKPVKQKSNEKVPNLKLSSTEFYNLVESIKESADLGQLELLYSYITIHPEKIGMPQFNLITGLISTILNDKLTILFQIKAVMLINLIAELKEAKSLTGYANFIIDYTVKTLLSSRDYEIKGPCCRLTYKLVSVATNKAIFEEHDFVLLSNLFVLMEAEPNAKLLFRHVILNYASEKTKSAFLDPLLEDLVSSGTDTSSLFSIVKQLVLNSELAMLNILSPKRFSKLVSYYKTEGCIEALSFILGLIKENLDFISHVSIAEIFQEMLKQIEIKEKVSQKLVLEVISFLIENDANCLNLFLYRNLHLRLIKRIETGELAKNFLFPEVFSILETLVCACEEWSEVLTPNIIEFCFNTMSNGYNSMNYYPISFFLRIYSSSNGNQIFNEIGDSIEAALESELAKVDSESEELALTLLAYLKEYSN